jgi:hypothetical protein
MRVFINEQEIPSTAPIGATIGEVVEASRMHVDPTEILTVVELDGVAFHAGDEEQFARRAASGVAALKIRTATPTAFAADKRRSLAETLDEVAARTRLVVQLLRQSETRSANGLLASLMEELRLTILLDYQLSMLADDAPSAARDEIAVLAPQMLHAEEKKKWDMLARLLDDSLAPILDRWATATRARLDAAA